MLLNRPDSADAVLTEDPGGGDVAHPLATPGSLVGKLGLTPATVNKALGYLEHLGIVKELTARKRNRVFSYAGYIDIMNRGTGSPGLWGS